MKRQDPCLNDPSALYRAVYHARELRRTAAAVQAERRRTFLRRKRRIAWQRFKRLVSTAFIWLLTLLLAAEIGGLAVLLLRR